MNRPVPLRRSLLVRLLAISLLIAMSAIITTALLTVRVTKQGVTVEQARTLSADADVYDAMMKYGATHRSWGDVQDRVRRLGDLTGRSIVLTTVNRKPIAESASGAAGTAGASPVPTATVDPLSIDTAIIRTFVGIDPRAVGPYRLTDAERRLLHKYANDQAACLGRQKINAEIVETPSGRPAVRPITGDAYSNSVSRCSPDDLLTPVKSEWNPLQELASLVSKCTGLKVVSSAVSQSGRAPGAADVHLTPLFTVNFERALGREQEAFVRQCVDEMRREQLRPFVAPPALLFVTSPVAGPAPAVNLSPANTLRVVATTLTVLAFAAVATIAVGVRLIRPLQLLIAAARLPADRQQPVAVTTMDEIGHLAAAFNDLSERRRALEQQRNAMVNDIAHELRTPLTNIRFWLEAARDGDVPVDREMLSLLVEESILLHHVVDDLRDISAADAGNLRIHPEPTFVKDLLWQVVDAHRGMAEAAAVVLELESESDPEMMVDPVRLRQIIGNLLSNAIRHTPEGGSVTVRMVSEEAHIAIEVADTGGGIAPGDLPKVFDRFWRADLSRTRTTGGSGLGLAIARQLARAHGGEVTAASRPGHGSVFTVDLPFGAASD